MVETTKPPFGFPIPAAGLFGRLKGMGSRPRQALIALPDMDEFETDYIQYLERLDPESAKPVDKGSNC